jgi:hypothetical protein
MHLLAMLFLYSGVWSCFTAPSSQHVGQQLLFLKAAVTASRLCCTRVSSFLGLPCLASVPPFGDYGSVLGFKYMWSSCSRADLCDTSDSETLHCAQAQVRPVLLASPPAVLRSTALVVPFRASCPAGVDISFALPGTDNASIMTNPRRCVPQQGCSFGVADSWCAHAVRFLDCFPQRCVSPWVLCSSCAHAPHTKHHAALCVV